VGSILHPVPGVEEVSRSGVASSMAVLNLEEEEGAGRSVSQRPHFGEAGLGLEELQVSALPQLKD
jgi:hypothetical protein